MRGPEALASAERKEATGLLSQGGSGALNTGTFLQVMRMCWVHEPSGKRSLCAWVSWVLASAPPTHTLPPGRNPKSGRLAPERTVMQMPSVPGTLSSCRKENLPESQKHAHGSILNRLGGRRKVCDFVHSLRKRRPN